MNVGKGRSQLPSSRKEFLNEIGPHLEIAKEISTVRSRCGPRLTGIENTIAIQIDENTPTGKNWIDKRPGQSIEIANTIAIRIAPNQSADRAWQNGEQREIFRDRCIPT